MKRSFLLLMVAGCASAGELGTSSDAPRTTSRISAPDDGYAVELTLTRDGARSSAMLPASVEHVWPAVVESFSDLGLPVTAIDPRARTAGMQNHRVRQIRGRRIAEYVSCGGAYGNNALHADVFLTALTSVTAQEAGTTRLQIEVDATARPQTQSRVVPCSSTGRLERELFELIQKKSVVSDPAGNGAGS